MTKLCVKDLCVCVTKLRVCDKEECDKVVSVTKLCVCVTKRSVTKRSVTNLCVCERLCV